MRSSEYPVYDFLAASRVERPLALSLRTWMARFGPIFSERWMDFAPAAIQVNPMLINAMSFEAAQSRWKQPSLGVPISIHNDTVTGLVVLRRSEFLVLVMEILRESLTERPADRELTSIETSMCNMVFQQFAATLGEAWPDKEKMGIAVGSLERQPNHCRMFPPQKEVVVSGFEVRTSCAVATGPVCFDWVFGKEELKRLLGVKDGNQFQDDGQRVALESIHGLSVELAVELGSVDLLMSELLALTAGDIVRLDQRIDVPLNVTVNRQPVMKVWPGRRGDTQSVQIESTTV
ncbi:MAG TPA: FliM/FliN family flagellar motor switch protein [Pirellulaceae bacterium]|nr:FliM/FliN family flagellar motor switch protein [Pirellulaceae bacterium]